MKEYYRQRWNESIRNQQLMAMNSTRGVICGFLLNLAQQFGRQVPEGILIDFAVPYEDIAGFCGISHPQTVSTGSSPSCGRTVCWNCATTICSSLPWTGCGRKSPSKRKKQTAPRGTVCLLYSI